MTHSHDPQDPANAHPLAEAADPHAAPHEPEAPAPLVHPLAEAATGTGSSAGASPAAPAPPTNDALVTIQVQVRPATAALLRAAAAREGADLAAMAALWLDEKAAAHRPPGPAPGK